VLTASTTVLFRLPDNPLTALQFVRIVQSWKEDHQEDTAAHEADLAGEVDPFVP
jgi:hypothetical protein